MDIEYWKDTLDKEIHDVATTLKSYSGSQNAQEHSDSLNDIHDKIVRVQNATLASFRAEIRLISDRKLRTVLQQDYMEYETNIKSMLDKISRLTMISNPVEDGDPIKGGDTILNDTERLQMKTQKSINQTRDMINEAKDVGMTTVDRLKGQRSQLHDVQESIIMTEQKLEKSDVLLKKFWRGSSKIKIDKSGEGSKKTASSDSYKYPNTLNTGAHFSELHLSVTDRLQRLHVFLQEEHSYKSEKGIFPSGKDMEGVAVRQSKIKLDMQRAVDELQQMNNIHSSEMNKKRSRYSPDVLSNQKRIIESLEKQLHQLKEKKHGLNGASSVVVAAFTDYSTGAKLTTDQSDRLLKISQRDADFDKQLDDLGECVKDLLEIAEMQNLEVDAQNETLKTLEADTSTMHDHMTNVNAKMKRTLLRIGRRG